MFRNVRINKWENNVGSLLIVMWVYALYQITRMTEDIYEINNRQEKKSEELNNIITSSIHQDVLWHIRRYPR
ncbi:hypothetical protein SPOG_01886 [Schizosaccharomyces cryophilus OY26]|uniref:Uncharacterized protein n=1 Tax=Schizosaccharomyces cryophilus (strain OY26 / ATCC MYA-4695 / CBS 11777 / NBRC 106824 / NRRL Y48691) TaxID=653667 RepID=S9XFZ5_SCHCR|nr:uncharacterized protein SPOG_01886 [Schizosaccharomyces cryophilus OY26]EPY52566.1 hypothetical protein SPOG_01886 [Schizosaccharomyces cryophilus OY26]